MTSLVTSLVTSLAPPRDGEGESGGLAELDNLKLGQIMDPPHFKIVKIPHFADFPSKGFKNQLMMQCF